MFPDSCLRPVLAAALAAAAFAPALAQETQQIQVQDQKQEQDADRAARRLPFKPDLPNTGSNHRLILKDGSFQLVRKYEVVGERVRYVSVERSGEWEELPAELVDWEATRKWERDHTAPEPGEASPAMKEAAELDKEESEAKAEQRARRPEVAKGLELPDSDGVWTLDTYKGTPELVELTPSEMAVNGKQKHGLSTLNPLVMAKAQMELEGQQARVHVHVNDPAIYLSLEGREDADKIVGHALTVNTGGGQAANGKHGAKSERSGFALVKLDERRAVRIVGAIRMSLTGTVTQDENVQPVKMEIVEGRRWLKITPAQPLVVGEYALVEIVSPSEINEQVWDFRVDPRMGENPSALGPLRK